MAGGRPTRCSARAPSCCFCSAPGLPARRRSLRKARRRSCGASYGRALSRCSTSPGCWPRPASLRRWSSWHFRRSHRHQPHCRIGAGVNHRRSEHPGRAGIGVINQKMVSVRLYKSSVLVMAASYLLWLPFTGYGWLVAFAATLGLGYGVRDCADAGHPDRVLRSWKSGRSAGCVSPHRIQHIGRVRSVAGRWIIDQTGSYQWGVAFALVMGVLGFIAILPLRRE